MVYGKMLNALLEHLLRQTLHYFLGFSLLCAEYKHLQHTRTAVADLFFSLKTANAYKCMQKWF